MRSRLLSKLFAKTDPGLQVSRGLRQTLLFNFAYHHGCISIFISTTLMLKKRANTIVISLMLRKKVGGKETNTFQCFEIVAKGLFCSIFGWQLVQHGSGPKSLRFSFVCVKVHVHWIVNSGSSRCHPIPPPHGSVMEAQPP